MINKIQNIRRVMMILGPECVYGGWQEEIEQSNIVIVGVDIPE